MLRELRIFCSTARMCLLEKSYFGFIEILGQYLLRAAALGALLMIWRSLFLQGADTEGFTLNQLYVYTILAAVLQPILNVETPASGLIHEGTVLGMYLRPRSVFLELIASTVGGWILPVGCMLLPGALAAWLVEADLRPVSLWALPSIALTASAGFAVDFLFSCLLIRMRALEWPVRYLRMSLSALLTGQLIPFAAMPWGIGKFLELTPFGSLAAAPLAIWTGLASPAGTIGLQLVWNLILWPLAVWRFSRAQERMVSYGG